MTGTDVGQGQDFGRRAETTWHLADREPYESALSLAGLQPFAKGSHRHCYVHPENPDLCVKVPACAVDEHCLAMQRRELEDYASLRNHGALALFERIPAMEGIVDTDLGIGIVSRLCRDVDGRISRNLTTLIREKGMSPGIAAAIDDLKRWLRAQRLLTRDTAPYNVVAIQLGEDEWKLVIVEGWVHRGHRWLARCHRVLAGYMIGRQLAKFDRRLPTPGLVRNEDPTL